MRPGVETLRRIPLFATLSPDGVIRLNEAGDLQRLGPDESLFGRGEQLERLHIVIAGFAALVHGRPGGDEVATDVIGPPSPLCLPAALLGVPTPAGARTISSVRLVLLPIPEIADILRTEPSSSAKFLDYALHDLHAAALEIADLKMHSSIRRLAGFLLGLVAEPDANPARFVLPFEKRYLAAKIGCSQENLSRAFAALRRIGVETRSRMVVIRDVAALGALAGAAPMT